MKMIVTTEGFDAKHARRMANSYAGIEGYLSDVYRRFQAKKINWRRHQEVMNSARERADHWNERADHLERFTRHGRRFIKGSPGLTEYTTADGLAINGIAFNELLEDTRRRIHARIDVRRSNADKLAMRNEVPYRFFNAIKMGSMWVDHVNRVMGPIGPGEGINRQRMYRLKGSERHADGSWRPVVNETGPELVEGRMVSRRGYAETVQMLPKGTPVLPPNDALRYLLHRDYSYLRTPTKVEAWDWSTDVSHGTFYHTAPERWYDKYVDRMHFVASNIFEYIATGLRTIWPKHK